MPLRIIMVTLDRRIRIINTLVNESAVKSTAEIADSLGITTNRVRYHLGRVAAWLTDHEVIIHKKYSLGIWTAGVPDAYLNLENHREKIYGYEFFLTSDHRHQKLVVSNYKSSNQ